MNTVPLIERSFCLKKVRDRVVAKGTTGSTAVGHPFAWVETCPDGRGKVKEWDVYWDVYFCFCLRWFTCRKTWNVKSVLLVHTLSPGKDTPIYVNFIFSSLWPGRQKSKRGGGKIHCICSLVPGKDSEDERATGWLNKDCGKDFWLWVEKRMHITKQRGNSL